MTCVTKNEVKYGKNDFKINAGFMCYRGIDINCSRFIVIKSSLIRLLLFFIKIFGNETFDYDKATGRTVRKTPEQKALRFKIYAVLAVVILLCFMVAKCVQ